MIVFAASLLVRDLLNANAAVTLYVATKGLMTPPSATPANQHFAPILKQPAALAQNVFAPGATSGRAQARIGDLTLANTARLDEAGTLDFWLDQYGFDGGVATVYWFDDEEVTSDNPADWNTLLISTMEQIELTRALLTVKLRGRLAELEIPLQPTLYLGTGGLEGGSELTGKTKPNLYGGPVRNITPPLVDPALLIYQVAENYGGVSACDVSAVYEGGDSSGITQGADYPDEATLLSTAPAAGTYRVLSDAGGTFFRLGSTPARLITCDAVMAPDDPPGIWLQILTEAGISNVATLTNLSTASGWALGLWTGLSPMTVADALARITDSVRGFTYTNDDGEIAGSRLIDPSVASPSFSLTQDDMVAPLERVASSDRDRGLPNWRVLVRWDRNYTVQTADLGGAVTQARRAELALEWRVATDEDTATQAAHPLSQPYQMDTLIVDATDAASAATSEIALRAVRRDRYQTSIRLDQRPAALTLGAVGNITHPRFGLSGGKDMVVLGIEPRITEKSKTLFLTLWG